MEIIVHIYGIFSMIGSGGGGGGGGGLHGIWGFAEVLVKGYNRKTPRFKLFGDLFRLCPPSTLCSPQLQSTCHYIVNYYVKILHVRLGVANNMRPLSWGGGAQTEKIPFRIKLNRFKKQMLYSTISQYNGPIPSQKVRSLTEWCVRWLPHINIPLPVALMKLNNLDHKFQAQVIFVL